MKLVINLDEKYISAIDKIKFLVGGRTDRKLQLEIIKAIKNGKSLEQEPTTKNDLGVESTPNTISFKEMMDNLKMTAEDIENAEDLEYSVEPLIHPKNDLGIDCISRADAIRVASGYCHPLNVAKELAKLPSVTPQEPRWISIDKQLPKKFQVVIASTDTGFVYPNATYSKEKGWEWAYESGTNYWRKIKSNVLAWMPLPTAYSEVEE